MKFGICNEIFRGWRWNKITKFVSSLGYNGIEIAPFTFAESVTEIKSAKRKEIKITAAYDNLEIVGIHWLLTSPRGLSITCKDKSIRKKTVNYLKALVDFCHDLGGKIMVFGSPKQRNIPKGTNWKTAFDFAKDCFFELLPAAEKAGVIIVLEPLGRKETNFINTADEALKIIKEINHPNFQLHLDVKAMSDEKKEIPEIIESAKGFLSHFHANDPNLSGPGFGKVDYKPIRRALEKIGYDRYISVEVFDFTAGEKIIAQKSLGYLKKIFE